MARWRSLLALAAVIVTAGLVGLWLLAASPSQAQSDQSTLARLISRLLSTPTTRVQIGRIQGALSSNAVITDVRVADERGVWLTLDRAELVWSRAALLRGRLQVDKLTMGRLAIERPPQPSVEGPPIEEGAADALLPELPVAVRVDEFRLSELVLGEPVLGVPARLSAQGSARLGDSQGLQLAFQAQRLEAPGRFAANLQYAPDTNRLNLDLTLDEPEGGLVARLLELPGLPPVSLRLNGQGPLSQFDARLAFDAGPTLGAEGTATVRRAGEAHRIDLNLTSQLQGLVPAIVQPVFRGTTRLAGDVTVTDDGALRVGDLRLASEVAALEVAGTVGPGPARELDLAIRGRALPTEGSLTRAGDTQIAKLDIDARVGGTLTAPVINGTVAAQGIQAPEGTLDSLNAQVAMTPVQGGQAGSSQAQSRHAQSSQADSFRFSVTGEAQGVRPADRAWARAIGPSVSLTARGTLRADGTANVEEARLSTPTATARYSGLFGARTLDGTLEAQIPSLQPIAALADLSLRGKGQLRAQLTGDPSRSQVTARLDGRLTELSSASPLLQGLLRDEVTLSGLARLIPNGFAFEDLTLAGANLSLRVDGRATQDDADLGLTLRIDALQHLDPRLGAGRAVIEARLTGSLERPDLRATATLSGVEALGRPIPRFQVTLDAEDITGLLNARLALEGQVGRHPARGSAQLRSGAGGGYTLEGLDVSIGSVTLRGDLSLTPDGLARGELRLAAGDLDDLSPLVLTKLDGALEATIALAVENGGQAARIEAEGGRLTFGATTLRDLTVELSAQDLYDQPVIDGVVEANALTIAGQTFRQIRLVFDGKPEATAFSLSAGARGFDLAAQGRLVPTDDALRIVLSAFSARRGERRLALTEPVTITLAEGVARFSELTLASDGGRLSLSGTLGRTLDLVVESRRLPLAIAEIAAPGLGLSGSVTGRATVTGTPADPRGTYEVALSDLSTEQLRRTGLRSVDVRAEGRLADGRATVDATLEAGRAGRLQVTGSVPLDGEGRLDLRPRGRIDLAAASGLLAAQGRRLTGAADLDLTVTGTVADPDVQGTVTVENGRFEDELRGIRLSGLQARLVAQGDVLRVERLAAATPNGGTIAASGQIRLDPQAEFPAELQVTGRRAQLVAGPVLTAVADLDLSVTGPLLGRPRIAGRVELVTLDVTVPDRLPATVQPIPGTKHVRPPPTAQARLALRRQRQAAARAGQGPFEAVLDLAVVAQNRIFVRGRGIHAELGGEVQLTGSLQDPTAVGAFELRRGRLDLLGQRLDFTRGRLDFSGELMPSLDFLAETRAETITARIAIEGPADSPQFTLSSDPDLPQDEILSRILFDRASGGLSAGQALQLAQGIATLSGGGPGAFDNLRRSLGVDSLDITTGAGGGVGLGLSRYITDNVRLGVKAGPRSEDAGVSVDVDLTRRLKLQGEVGADGDSAVGLGMEWEY